MIRMTQEAGIVHLLLSPPWTDGDEDAYRAALETVGERAGPYALVVEMRGHMHLSREGEVWQSLWAKRTRAQVSACCRAVGIVRDDPTERQRQSFARLWGLPVLATRDAEAAFAFVRAHLEREELPCP